MGNVGKAVSTPKIPLLMLTYGAMDGLGRRMRFIGKLVKTMRPSLSKELESLGVPLEAEYYGVGSLFSAFFYGLLFAIMTFAILLVNKDFQMDVRIRVTAAVGISFFAIFYVLHLVYPSILLKKKAVRSEKDLLFALREIMLGVNSGVPLFDTLKNVSNERYGQVSEDFSGVVKKIESGMAEKEALKELALLTESEYMRRAIWQMINALESGASMSTALPGIVDALENQTYRNIRSYSANLNFLMLVYMLIAAAIPSLGITFLVLLSAFSGMGVSVDKILMLIGGSALGQIVMIGYMASTRPEIFGG